MAGAQQRGPVAHANPDVTALLQHRYALYKIHGLSLDRIARELKPSETTAKQRNLAAKIGRFFRDGSGAVAQRWSYLEAEIKLGFPADEQPDQIRACAALYRRAFPNATDCPYHGTATIELSLADHVRRSVEDSMRLLGDRGSSGELSDEDVDFIHGRLVPLLDRGSLFNPCLQAVPLLRAAPHDRLTPNQRRAITLCDEQIAAIDRALATLPRRATRRLRGYILDHLSEHQRMLAEPGSAPSHDAAPDHASPAGNGPGQR
jgi:hypothetical protein